jgi:small-conductance mechanosensitive channel
MRPLKLRPIHLFLATLLVVSLNHRNAEADGEIGAEPAPPVAQSSASPEEHAESSNESEERRAKFETLRENRLQRLRNVAALEADAANAVGDDQLALQGQMIEWRLEGADTFLEMWGLIEATEEAEEDATPQRSALAALLPALRDSVRRDYTREAKARDALKVEQAALTDVEAIAAIESTVRRKNVLLLRILGVGADVAEISGSLDAESGSLREWLASQVLRKARLATSHVNLSSQRVTEVGQRIASATDAAPLQPALAAANAQYESTLASLALLADLMDRLEIDATEYRQLLVASTGEITVDAIDSDVVGELLSSWTADLRENVANNGATFALQIFLFLLVLGIFWGLSRFVRKIVSHAVEAPHLRFSQLLKRMIVSLSTSAVLVVGLLIALSQVGIEVAPMLAGLGIVGFVLGFALQDTLGNFAAGVMILIYRPFDVGDMIDCAGGVFGQVSHMSLVSTTILTIDNKTLIVPNGKIWGDVITNVTAQAIRRIDLEFGIGYGDDIPHAEEVLWSIIKDHPKVLADPEPVVKVHSLGDSSVNFVVRPWVARDDYWDVHWDFMREVKLRFDREGVSIPFPQRDVHFYSTDGPIESAEASAGGREEPMEMSSTPQSAGDEPEA